MVSYKDSGVNKEEGYRAVEKFKASTSSTYNEFVLNELGSFAGMYELPKYKNPVLVSGTDGVGTKLEIAFKTNIYNTVGIDCVAMCSNDVLCHGAKPLFFLDYLACGNLDSNKASELVQGVSVGCKESLMALIGGETAEMPGFYKKGDYDIAGFCVGIVEKDEIINGDKVEEGNILIGLKSSGLHSNGFSLVRKVITDYYEDFKGEPIYKTLLTPTKIYVKSVLEILKKYKINGMAHITGGGIYENLPRAYKKGLEAIVFKDKMPTQDIFKYIAEKGNINSDEMYNTFNMGVGFVLIADKKDKDNIINDLNNMGEEAFELGYIQKGENKLCLR